MNEVVQAYPDSLRPHGLQPHRLLCPWDFPGKSIGVGCHFLLQGIFPTQGLNPGLPHCRQTLRNSVRQVVMKFICIHSSNLWEECAPALTLLTTVYDEENGLEICLYHIFYFSSILNLILYSTNISTVAVFLLDICIQKFLTLEFQ